MAMRLIEGILAIALILVFSRTQASASSQTVASAVPDPIDVPASGAWGGGYGNWSLFDLRIGTPPQALRVLISTVGQATWVVGPDGCNGTSQINCTDLRGGVYNHSASSSFQPKNNYELGSGTDSAENETALFGIDTIRIGNSSQSGLSLDGQVMAIFSSTTYLTGLFGIGPGPIMFSGYEVPRTSFLATLKSQGKIPSLSWGYTAGASYRNQPGKLTFGGYDSVQSQLTGPRFPIIPDTTCNPGAGLQSLTVTTRNGSSSVLQDSITAIIDSSTPDIWLPLSACKKIEQALGLVWDETSQSYPVDDLLHLKLLASNTSIDFKLGNPNSSDSAVSIVLPYAAFDLTTLTSLPTNSSRYFPLKRATNETQYTLGRVFLQEAYIVADYERSYFQISQVDFNIQYKDIRPIYTPDYENTILETKKKQSHQRNVIIGTTVGGITGGILLLSIAWLLWRRKRPRVNHQTTGITPSSEFTDFADADTLKPSSSTLHPSTPDAIELVESSEIQPEIDGSGIHEIASEQRYELAEQRARPPQASGTPSATAGRGGRAPLARPSPSPLAPAAAATPHNHHVMPFSSFLAQWKRISSHH